MTRIVSVIRLAMFLGVDFFRFGDELDYDSDASLASIEDCSLSSVQSSPRSEASANIVEEESKEFSKRCEVYREFNSEAVDIIHNSGMYYCVVKDEPARNVFSE